MLESFFMCRYLVWLFPNSSKIILFLLLQLLLSWLWNVYHEKSNITCIQLYSKKICFLFLKDIDNFWNNLWHNYYIASYFPVFSLMKIIYVIIKVICFLPRRSLKQQIDFKSTVNDEKNYVRYLSPTKKADG